MGNDSKARELAFTAGRFDAAEAKEMGFISRVIQGGRKEVTGEYAPGKEAADIRCCIGDREDHQRKEPYRGDEHKTPNEPYGLSAILFLADAIAQIPEITRKSLLFRILSCSWRQCTRGARVHGRLEYVSLSYLPVVQAHTTSGPCYSLAYAVHYGVILMVCIGYNNGYEGGFG